MTVIKSRIIKIGNSQGLRIPKVLLEQLNLRDEVELEVQENQLIDWDDEEWNWS
jgi:antitoxin MazE